MALLQAKTEQKVEVKQVKKVQDVVNKTAAVQKDKKPKDALKIQTEANELVVSVESVKKPTDGNKV